MHKFRHFETDTAITRPISSSSTSSLPRATRNCHHLASFQADPPATVECDPLHTETHERNRLPNVYSKTHPLFMHEYPHYSLYTLQQTLPIFTSSISSNTIITLIICMRPTYSTWNLLLTAWLLHVHFRAPQQRSSQYANGPNLLLLLHTPRATMKASFPSSRLSNANPKNLIDYPHSPTDPSLTHALHEKPPCIKYTPFLLPHIVLTLHLLSQGPHAKYRAKSPVQTDRVTSFLHRVLN